MKPLRVNVSNRKVYPVYLEDRVFLGFVFCSNSKNSWKYQTAGHYNGGSGGFYHNKATAIRALVKHTCSYSTSHKRIQESLVKSDQGRYVLTSEAFGFVNFEPRYRGVKITEAQV